MVIKTNRSDKTEIKKFLKISGHQQRWPRPLPGAILIPPALLVVADLMHINLTYYTVLFCEFGFRCRVSGEVDAIALPEH